MCNQPRQLTSADIARLAGVSRSTVSRVINGYANVPEDTRHRVLDAIDRYGYCPSVSGQTLRGKSARCIGVFLGETGWQTDLQATMLYDFSQSAQALGYLTLSGKAGDLNGTSDSRAIREILCSGCVDAGVFLNASGGDALIGQLLTEGRMIAALGMPPQTAHERLFTLGLDTSVGQRAVDYICAQGYRQVILLCDPASFPDCAALCRLFLAAAAERDLWVHSVIRKPEVEFTRQAMEAVDAVEALKLIVCTDQASLCAAYRVAALRQQAVGEELSILAMGLLPSQLPFWPPVTGFRFRSQDMAASLSERLIQALEGEPETPRYREIGFEWMAGASCGVKV